MNEQFFHVFSSELNSSMLTTFGITCDNISIRMFSMR